MGRILTLLMATTTIKPPLPPASSGPPSDDGAGRGPSVSGAAVIVVGATLLSRVLGLIRDVVIAHQLGATADSDIYNGAFKVCDLLMYLVAGGALSSTFIPVFKEYLHQKKERQAWQAFSVVATVTAIVAVLFVLLAEVFTPMFVHLVNHGYTASQVARAVPLVRIILPAQIFFMLGGLLMGTLNARGQFLIPALGPSVYNLGIMFGAAVLYPMGLGLPGLMWGGLLGAFLGNFALQIVPVARLGMRYRPSLAVLHPGAVKVWKMMLPILLGVSLPNVDQLITGNFASELSTGSQASIGFATRMMLIPIGIFAQAMGIAILPTMASQAAANQRRAFRATLNKGLRTILFLTVPSSALLFLLAQPVVVFLLQSGRFTPEATLMTASALRFYSIGIFAWSVQAILTRGFYALQDSRTPVVSGTIMTVLFIAMSWLVVNASSWGVSGLALVTTIAATLHMLVLLVVLRHRLKGLQDLLLLTSVIKTSLATAALCLVVIMLRSALEHLLPGGGGTPKLHAAVVLAIAGGGGLVAFAAAARALRMDELQSVMGLVRRRRG